MPALQKDGDLDMLVRDLMKVGVTTVGAETPAVEIARLLVEQSLEGVVVLSPEDGNALGMVTQDELAAVFGKENAQSLTAVEVMREDIPQVPPDIPLRVAVQIMRDQHTRVLFLLHHSGGIQYPAAYLTYSHVMRCLAARSADDLRDLGIHAERTSPLQVFIARRDASRKAHGGS